MNKTESIREFLTEIIHKQIQLIELTSEVQKHALEHVANLLAEPPESGETLPDKEPCEEKEFSLYDYYSLTKRDDVMISYKGPVTDVILAEISRDIRNKFAETPKVSKKLFSIFIELAQNILYYSSEKIQFSDRNDSVGTILITRRPEHLTFSCGNLVENKYIDDLVEGCNKINSLNRNELREYKRATRSSPKKERSKGAGIGLIQVALTSGSPLEVESRPIDEIYSFFSLSVKIRPFPSTPKPHKNGQANKKEKQK